MANQRGVLKIVLVVWLALGAVAIAANLSALAPAPDWSKLQQFQGTITHNEFVALLDTVYAQNGGAKNLIAVEEKVARIKTSGDGATEFVLRFAEQSKPAPKFWRRAAELPRSSRPLAGVRIALDPGHLGGKWAKLEERWFQIDSQKPVCEGDMTLLVARLISTKLRALGAEVSMVRESSVPTTADRPATLTKAARAELRRQGIAAPAETYTDPNDPEKNHTVQWESELLFYRVSEIHARARFVNRTLRPDLTLCLHFNAEAWGDPAHPQLVEKNHFHMLINGSYSEAELAFDDVRCEMLLKLLSRTYAEELPAAQKVAAAVAKTTGLAPYEYSTGNATRIAGSDFLWTRNLLANRLYHCPVLYIEPYVMNSPGGFARVQLGDYEGEREVAGQMRRSIFREYADGLIDGLVDYYRSARPGAAASAINAP